MQINKIIYGGETLIDLTADTVQASTLLAPATAHDKSGAAIVGTCTYDQDTSDATVSVNEILATKSAYARGAKLVGTLPNIGAIDETISNKDTTITVAYGCHDGQGTVKIQDTEKAKLIPTNIREGVSILGVLGEMSGSEGENALDNINVTPSKTQQIITPTTGYTCMRQVTVAAIPYTETENAAGGITVTIG